MQLKALESTVYGFIGQRKNLNPGSVKIFLKKLGIEGNYEGIGHCAIGYAAEPVNAPAPRKENYVYYVK